MTIYLNSGFMSSKEASKELGVSQHQVAMLAKRGEIASVMVGGTLLIDPLSLRTYRSIAHGSGRPWAPQTAWAALWLLSGLEAPWLSYQQRRRLRLSVLGTDAPTLLWQVRKRAELHVFKADPSLFPQIKEGLVLSGKSTDRPDIFGMPRNDDEVEGYASAEAIEVMAGRLGLSADIAGNVLVHVIDEAPWGEDVRKQMPVGVVAADLAASLDPRESRAGNAALGILLGALQRS